MAMFGPFEEMTVFRPGTRIPDKKKMAEKTLLHLQAGTPVICEAAFLNYNNYCAADILRKTGKGYDLYEVKNAPEVRELSAEPGEQCTNPYECWYYGYCHGQAAPAPEQITMEGL